MSGPFSNAYLPAQQLAWPAGKASWRRRRPRRRETTAQPSALARRELKQQTNPLFFCHTIVPTHSSSCKRVLLFDVAAAAVSSPRKIHHSTAAAKGSEKDSLVDGDDGPPQQQQELARQRPAYFSLSLSLFPSSSPTQQRISKTLKLGTFRVRQESIKPTAHVLPKKKSDSVPFRFALVASQSILVSPS